MKQSMSSISRKDSDGNLSSLVAIIDFMTPDLASHCKINTWF